MAVLRGVKEVREEWMEKEKRKKDAAPKRDLSIRIPRQTRRKVEGNETEDKEGRERVVMGVVMGVVCMRDGEGRAEGVGVADEEEEEEEED